MGVRYEDTYPCRGQVTVHEVCSPRTEIGETPITTPYFFTASRHPLYGEGAGRLLVTSIVSEQYARMRNREPLPGGFGAE